MTSIPPSSVGPTPCEFDIYIRRALAEGHAELVPLLLRFEAVRWPAQAAAALARFDGLPMPS